MQLRWRGTKRTVEVLGAVLILGMAVTLTIRGAKGGSGTSPGFLSRSVGCGPGTIVSGNPLDDAEFILAGDLDSAEEEGDDAGEVPDGAVSADGALDGARAGARDGVAVVPTADAAALDQSLCWGDVPCGPVFARPPSPACASVGANAHFVVSVGPSTAGYAEAAMDLPAVGARVAEPDFGTCMTRATSPGWMNGYCRFSAFNADSSRLLVRKAGGDWYVLDANALGRPTLSLGVSGDDAAPRWHGRDPDVVFYMGSRKLMRHQVSSAAATVAFDPSLAPGLTGCGGIQSLGLGGSEGESSASSRYWGFHVVTGTACNGNTRHFVTVDLATGESWVHTLPAGRDHPDNSSMSATGKFFVTNDQSAACSGTGTLASPCGVMAYSLHLDAAFMVHASAGHHDEALSKEGHDVVVMKSNVVDFIVAVDLETRTQQSIAALNLSGAQAWDFHVSGNNWAAPGWVLLSQDSSEANGHYLSRQIVAVELADRSVARVVHLAHHRTLSSEYWTKESHASVNADFTRVAWHTNWYGGSAEADNSLFFLELPPGFLGGL
jgi:hypothetical protein